MNNSKKLPLTKPLLFFLGFIILLVILFLSLTEYDKSRKAAVYNRYAQETNAYVAQNKESVNKFFTQMFPNSTCVRVVSNNIPVQPSIASGSSTTQVCAFPNAEAIGHTLPTTLKDWSSTKFLKLDAGEVLVMDLSGNTREFYSPKRDIVIKLLKGEDDQIPWDSYTYELPSKQVIIQIKDNSGKIIGAIMRGVIE